MMAWLVGKKTYLAAIAFAVVVVVLIFLGKLTPELAINLALFAIPLFATTFRSALKDRNQALKVLTDIALAGAAYRTHSTGAMVTALESVAADAAAPSDTLSVNFSGSRGDVLHAINAVQVPASKIATPTDDEISAAVVRTSMLQRGTGA